MAFVDISGDEQRRIDEQLQRYNQGIINAANAYGDIQESKRQRALKAYELKRQLEDQAGRPLKEQESKSVEDFIQTGQEGKGLGGLFSDISKRKNEAFKAEQDYKKARIKSPTGESVQQEQMTELPKLSAEEKNKIGGIAEGFRALADMESSLKSGQQPEYITPDSTIFGLPIGKMVPDTDFSRSQRVLDEVVGRLQSGGVIGNEELVTFRNMGPRAADSPEMRIKKLNDQRSFLTNKLKAYNLSPEQLGQFGFNVAGSMPIKPQGAAPQGYAQMEMRGESPQIPYAPQYMGVPGINDAMAAPVPQGMVNKEGLKSMSRADKIKMLKGK